MLDSKERTGFVRTYVGKIKCNSREYVAFCVDTEGASTRKKRRKEVRQRKESYTGNNTVFQ